MIRRQVPSYSDAQDAQIPSVEINTLGHVKFILLKTRILQLLSIL